MKLVLWVKLLFSLLLLFAPILVRAEDRTLNVMTNRVGAGVEVLKNIAKSFEQENPGVRINFSAPGAEYEKLMKVKMAANDLPDVFSTHGWSKVRYGSFLADLRNESWAPRINKSIRPIVTDAAGKVFVLPMDQDRSGPVYNVDLLNSYGVSVPSSWKEMLAACETIKNKSSGKVSCIHIGGADSWTIGNFYDFLSNPLAISPKKNDAQSLLDGTYNWSKYEVLSTELLLLKNKGYLNKDVLTAKYDDSARAFAEGRVAFGFYGPYFCEEAQKLNAKLNCGLMPIPAISAGDKPTFVGGEVTTWGVWKDSKNMDLAKKLVAYYAKPENVAAVANVNKLPAGIDGVTIDAGFLTPYYKKYNDVRVLPYFDRIYLPNGMWDVLCRAGQDVLAGNKTAAQVTNDIKQAYLRLRKETSN